MGTSAIATSTNMGMSIMGTRSTIIMKKGA